MRNFKRSYDEQTFPHVLRTNGHSTDWRELLPFMSLSTSGREINDQRRPRGRHELHNVCQLVEFISIPLVFYI